MKIIDEIAHRYNATGDRVTDFYLVHKDPGWAESPDRFKVTETAHPIRIVAGEVAQFRYDYVVSVLRPTGWVEVARIGEEHVETALHAALAAHRIITEVES